MRKKIQFLIMILALGMFIFPTQNLLAQTTTMDCCQTQKTDKDSCHKGETKDSNCSKNHNSHQGCKDNCCSNCNSCQTSFVLVFLITEKDHSDLPALADSKKDYKYTNPHFSSLLKEIWQPPKIA